jgi:hypothetical protein
MVIGEHVNPTWVPPAGIGSPSNPKSSLIKEAEDCYKIARECFQLINVDKKPHVYGAVAALDATRVALGDLANVKNSRGSDGKPSKGDDKEENGRGANEHVGEDWM